MQGDLASGLARVALVSKDQDGPSDAAAGKGAAQEAASSEAATSAYSSSDTSSINEGSNSLEASLLESYLQSSQLSGSQGHDGAQGRTSFELAAAATKPQICFDFTKGVCTRGDKCKYSHDLATIVHFNSREKGICFDYLRNQCTRGLLCRFSHDLSNIAQQCQLYNSAAISSTQNKQGKPNAICYDFVKGVCQRGSECRYSHDLSLIARMARGGPSAPKTAEVCYDYLRGRCNRGVTCKYSHNISFLAAPNFLGAGTNSGPNSGGQAQVLQPSSGQNSGISAQQPQPAGGSFSAGSSAPGGSLLPGIAQQLTTAYSADQATLQAYAAAAAADRQRMSFTGDANDTASVNDQPPQWPPAGAVFPTGLSAMQAGPMAAASKVSVSAQQAAMLNSLAAQQHLHQQHQRIAAVAAAGMGGFPAMGVAAGFPGQAVLGQPGVGGNSSTPLPPMGHMYPVMPPFSDGPHSSPFQGLPGPVFMRPQMQRPMAEPQQGLTPESIAAYISNMPHNPMLLADTLSNFAAVAKVQAEQTQQMRMHKAPHMGPGMPASAAQPIPGRMDMVPGHAFPPEALSRSAPGAADPLNPAALSPDLLPMIREIWQSKPGC